MSATDFVPIRVSTLRGEASLTFKAYISVGGKYILYCKEGDSLEGERLQRLQEKRLKKMWIHTADEDNYRQYMTANIEAAYDKSSNTPIESKDGSGRTTGCRRRSDGITR
ncbi:MAG: hypothetical protein R2827_02120 [Bdellovibrionales bacterium]